MTCFFLVDELWCSFYCWKIINWMNWELRIPSETYMWDTERMKPDEWKDGMPRYYRSLVLSYNCPVFLSDFSDLLLTAFEISASLLHCVNFDLGCSWFVFQNGRIPPQNGNLLEALSSWIEQSFFPCQMTWFALQWRSLAKTLGYFVSSSKHFCLSSTVQDTTPEGVLAWCWCSLTLTLTTSMGIW